MNKPILHLLAAGCLAACTLAAQAQHRVPHGGPPLHLDARYGHDRYYPSVGFGFSALPAGAVGVGYHGSRWFFHGGVWFRPAGPRFIVALPPVGIVVPYLPAGFVPVWIAGVPYYYGNGVYYASAPEGYVVVTPPMGAATAQVAPVTVPAPLTLVIYPRNGQPAAQIENDRAACNEWANGQPGAASDPALFQRGFAACMDGRGYSVR